MTVIRYRLLNGRPYVVTQPGGGGGGTTYATTFAVTLSSSSGTVGAGQTVTVSPVGGSWPVGQSIALHVTGPTYAASPDARTGSGTTPVTFSFTPSAAGSFTVDAIATGMTSTGTRTFTASSAAPMSQAFTVTNWGSGSSLGSVKRGVWFKKGDVPSGSVPVIDQGTAQFYALSRWKDGSLKTARMLLRDANLAAGSSRTYTITSASGSLSGAVAANGNAGLVSALSGHDFKMAFANVKDYQANTYGGGTLTASLATHAAVGTRWQVLSTGPVADVWQGWGMAGSDVHLKVNWYVTRWKNADGSTLGFQIGAAPALDWWDVAGKTDLTYDAALMDGSTTILNFPGVSHFYHAQWLACINDGSANAGRVPWIGATTPTLDYTFDKTYAILANVVHPIRRDRTPPARTQYPYVPCAMISPEGHRFGSTDAGGGYLGRGPVPVFDTDAFMLQTPTSNAISRLNALSGLSITYHYRSAQNRTRSGEAADMANTNIPLIMRPKASSYSDFTAQGLPAAIDAYRGNGGTGGFVNPNQLSSNPWGGGSLDATHAVSYSYYAALITGDEWFTDAQIDLAMNLAHQQIYGYHQQRPPWATLYNPSCPTATYTGLLGQWQDYLDQRHFAWSWLIQGHASGLMPDDHQFRPALTALTTHGGDYIALNLDYLPADFAAASEWTPDQNSNSSPWQISYQAMGAYFHFMLNEDTRWQRVGDYCANWSISQAEAGRFYAWDMFRVVCRAGSGPWNATTNPNIPAVQHGFLMHYADLAANGTFTQTGGSNWNDLGAAPPPMRNGDTMILTNREEGGTTNGKIPAGVVDGTRYYVVNVANGGNMTQRDTPNCTWQLAATLGGTPLTFNGTATTDINMAWCPAAAGDPAFAVVSQPVDYLHFPYFFSWDNYIPGHMTAFAMARHTGNTRVTTALRDAANAFVAPNPINVNYISSFDSVAIV